MPYEEEQPTEKQIQNIVERFLVRCTSSEEREKAGNREGKVIDGKWVNEPDNGVYPKSKKEKQRENWSPALQQLTRQQEELRRYELLYGKWKGTYEEFEEEYGDYWGAGDGCVQLHTTTKTWISDSFADWGSLIEFEDHTEKSRY